jgi:hypothetical protein
VIGLWATGVIFNEPVDDSDPGVANNAAQPRELVQGVVKDSSGNDHHGKIVEPTWLQVFRDDSERALARGVIALGGAVWVIDPPVNLGPGVNSHMDDSAPALSADGRTLFFSSHRLGGNGQNDLWMTTRTSPSEPFGPPVNLGPVVNGSRNDRNPTLSADGRTLIFSSDRPGGHGDTDLWMTTRTSAREAFGPPMNMGPIVNSSAADSAPLLSTDGCTLIFSTSRPGGFGHEDLWMAARAAPGTSFGPPVNLGPGVNSEAVESAPTLSNDGRTVIFNSSRGGGLGLEDLWMATRTAVGDPFGAAMNLGPVVNSSNHDGHPDLSADGRTLSFQSTRPGGQGDGDLWMARIRRPEDAPQSAAWPVRDTIAPADAD